MGTHNKNLACGSVVIDTNMLLDCFVFCDPAVQRLRYWLEHTQLHWLATPAMQQEFLRVLKYPAIEHWLCHNGMTLQVLHFEIFERYATLVEQAPAVPFICKDPDDQKFIDLAVAHRAFLLSKDKAVLRLRARLKHAGVLTAATEAVLLAG